jgi:DNA polymerase-1
MRMLAYIGVKIPSAECTSNLATLTNEHRPSFALDNLARAYNLGSKADSELHDWMVRHLQQFKLKPTRKSCAPHYWRVPQHIMAPYALHDPVLTFRYYNAAWSELAKENVGRVYRLECALMPMLIKMHLCGVRADLARVEKLQSELGDRLVALDKQWREMCDGEEISVNSPKDMRPIMDKLGLHYALTKGRKDKEGKIIESSRLPSVNKEWLEALEHPFGALVRSIRQAKYYSNTSLQNYILGNLLEGEDVIHGEFHPLRGDEYGTITGRFSSGGGLNLQNIPARDEYWAPLLRSVFRPMRDDQQWLKIDYSQIEYRLFAHYAGLRARLLHQQDPLKYNGVSAMEEAYVANPDIDFHDWVAKTADIGRKRAKNVNFCKLYGGGITKIALTAGCDEAEARVFVGKYERAIPEAKDLMQDLDSAAARRGYVTTWYGRRCRFQTEGEEASRFGSQPENELRTNRYARTYKALNKVLQGSAADIIKVAMVEIDKAIDWDDTQLHLQVHDELDFSVPKGDAGVKVKDNIVEIMQEAAKTPMWNGEIMRVPVIAEADLGPNWGMLA